MKVAPSAFTAVALGAHACAAAAAAFIVPPQRHASAGSSLSSPSPLDVGVVVVPSSSVPLSSKSARTGKRTSSTAIRSAPYGRAARSGELEEGDADVEVVTDLVARRVAARLDQDYTTADAIQRKLKAEYNVFMDDKSREWGVGQPKLLFDDDRSRNGGGSRPPQPYEMSAHSLEMSPEDVSHVARLTGERAAARQDRNYDLADAICDELHRDYGVSIDDRLRQWSAGGRFPAREDGSDGRSRPYVKSSRSLAPPGGVADEGTIAKRVAERVEAKKKRDYDLADTVRSYLKDRFDVTINDRLREWSVGGEFSKESGWLDPDRDYAQRGGNGDFGEGDVALIRTGVMERHLAKKNRDYDRADEIRCKLSDKYGVSIDDKKREWRIVSDAYAYMGSDGGALSEAEVQTIQQRLVERTGAKKARDYDAADAIRDELEGRYSVSIDDKVKEWRVVTSTKDAYAMEAARSQQSAFARTQIRLADVPAAAAAASGSTSGEDNEGLDADFNDADTSEDVVLEQHGEEEVEELTETAVSPTSDPVLMDESLLSLTVVQLKERLRGVGRPVSGRKAELIERLSEHNTS